MKKFLALSLVLALMLGLLAGCGDDSKTTTTAAGDNETTVAGDTTVADESEETESQVASVPPAKSHDEPYVYRTTNSKVKTLNPHIYETSAEIDTMSYIYGNLLEMVYDEANDTYKVVGSDAVDLPVRSEDGLTWTFTLKDDLKFADGTPYNAYDYEYSYKMLLDPKMKNSRGPQVFNSDLTVVNANNYWMGDTQPETEEGETTEATEEAFVPVTWEEVGIKALDEKTLEITLEYAIPELDFYIAFNGGTVTSCVKKDLYEAGMNEDRTSTTYGTSFETVASNGAYKLTEWVRDQNMVYERNENSKINQVYTVDRVEVRVVEDSNTNVQLFENGDIDVTALTGPNYEKYEEDPRVVFGKSTSVWSMFVNMTSEEKPFIADVNFRKALFFAMDREVLAHDIMKTAMPASYVVASAKIALPSTGTSFRDTEQGKSVMPENNGYDLDKAKEFMNKAYEAYGKQMIFEIQYFDTSENMKKMAEFLEKHYETVFGKDVIDVQLRGVPWMNAYENMQNGKYDAAFGAWQGGLFNPWSSMEVYTSDFTMKLDQFFSDEFDELYTRTVKGDLIFKEQERLDALAKMEGMLLDIVPFIPMFESRAASIYADRVDLITGGEYVPGIGFGVMQSEFTPLQ